MQPNPVQSPLAPAQQPRARRFRTFRVISALMLRETGTRETRTSLGFLWTFIEPIATVVLLSYCFSLIQRTPRFGTSFELFYVTGVLPYHLFTHVTSRVASSIRFSGNLLGFPSVTVVDVLMARFILNVFTDLIVFLVLIIGVVWWYDLDVNPDLGAVTLSLTMAAALGLGLGTLNSVLFLSSTAYETFWTVLMRPMAIFVGVMFPITDMPDYVFNVLKWIPMAHFVGEMRHAFYPAYEGGYIWPAYVFGIAAVSFVLGLVGLQRYVFDLLERR